MKKNILFLALFLASCQPPSPQPQGGRIMTDGLGRTVRLQQAPQRIISFAPSLTEMVYALNAQDLLVGVTAWCTFPSQAKAKPAVGDYLNPNLERIAMLKPDLVIMVGTSASPVLAKLQALDVPAFVFRSEAIADIGNDLRLLGAITGAGKTADSLARCLKVREDSLRSAVNSIPAPLRPRVFAEISSQPLMSANAKSYIGELVALAGGINIADSLPQPYGVINAELVVRQRPDIILVLHPQSSANEVRQRLGWGSVPAVRHGRVYAQLDLDLLMRPGPRYPEAARALNRIFYEQK